MLTSDLSHLPTRSYVYTLSHTAAYTYTYTDKSVSETEVYYMYVTRCVCVCNLKSSFEIVLNKII